MAAKRGATDIEPFLEHVENSDALRKQIAERVFVPEQRHSDESRLTFGRRGMSLVELSEFVRVIRNQPEVVPGLVELEVAIPRSMPSLR